MKPPQRAQAARAQRDHANDFYEMIPMTMSSHYVYRDDTNDHLPAESVATDPQAAARRLAVITLLALAVAASVVGFALAEGLAILQAALGTPI